MRSELEQLKQVLHTSTSFVLTTHVSPDCDGLGSEIALAAFLSGQGKTVTVINDSETPESYRFLDPQGIIQRYEPSRHDRILTDSDAIVVIDTNHPDRLGSMGKPVRASKARRIVIDHHLDADPFGDLYLIDDSAAATGEIIYRIFEGLGETAIPQHSASALYSAIMTDTGSFRFPKTDADLHRIIARLIERGADPVSLYETVYEQDTPNRVRLLGKVLAGIKTAHSGRVAYLTVTAAMFDETETSEPDIDRFAPYALTIKGVRIGLMFTELPNQIKVSFRSKGDIPINNLAREFGGNGHKNAAGARITGGSLERVVKQIVSRSEQYLTN